MVINDDLVGGKTTYPSENYGLRQMGWWNSQLFLESQSKFHGSSQHQPVMVSWWSAIETTLVTSEDFMANFTKSSRAYVCHWCRMGPPNYKLVYKPWNNPHELVRYIYHKPYLRHLELNPGLINHGLLIRGYSSNSHNLILKWYPPN